MEARKSDEPASTGHTAELRLHAHILKMELDASILKFLLPDGKPHEYETSIWDYKTCLPNTAGRGTAEDLQQAALEIAELVKDVVAFHNAYGGYIVAGVAEGQDDPIVGCDNVGPSGFSIDKFNDQVFAYTKKRIACRLARFDLPNGAGATTCVAIILVPMRAATEPAVKLTKGAPERKGKSSFQKGAIYARLDDRCVPVEDDADGIRFLCSARQFRSPAQDLRIAHNLPPQDPNLIRFVGRTEYLFKLWQWLTDRHSPVKVLSALGGTGKTSIAYRFSLQLIESPPAGLEKMIWLSAKKQTYSAVQGKYVQVTRTDFADIDDFFRCLAGELGYDKTELLEEDRPELLDISVDALTHLPSMVVIDDIDTLAVDQQNELFALVQAVAGQVATGGSRFLITSRLELGAESQRVMVRGFEEPEFTEYATLTAQSLGVELNAGLVKQLYRASLGSPIFCSSILRLASLGTNISQAISRWKGKEGEQVRRFTFQKELDELTEDQTRVLFALATLGETTQLELRQVLEMDDPEITRDLAKLREFHLFASRGDPRTGTKLEVPEPIILMRDILAERIHDPKRIEKDCARARARTPRVKDNVSAAVASVLALWREDDYEAAALAAAAYAQENKRSGDLFCLLGQSYLKLTPAKPTDADKAFAKAWQLACKRPEFLPAWLAAKLQLSDWRGIIDLVAQVPPSDLRSSSVLIAARAEAELGLQAIQRKDIPKALDRLRNAMMTANAAVASGRAGDKLPDLRDLTRNAARRYVSIVDQENPRPNDRLAVFNAVDDAFRCHIAETPLLSVGLEALRTWAMDAGQRSNAATKDIMGRRLERLREMLQHVTERGAVRPQLAQQFESTEQTLLRLLG